MKRKGFTLVELLIVIAVIGALATMMTLSAGKSAAKAKAASIISGFKIVRTAVIEYELASADEGPTAYYFANTASKEYVGPESVALLVGYVITSTDATGVAGVWTATYTYGKGNNTVEDQITKVAGSLGVTVSKDDGTASMKVR